VRIITGAKLVFVEKENSCVDLSKTYPLVSRVKFSAVLVA
jgi:hypothetical protein